MNVTATTDAPRKTGADTIVIGVFAGEGIAHDLPGEPLAELLRTGEAGHGAGHIALWHLEGRRVLLIGLGERDAFTAEHARAAAGHALARASELGTRSLCWEVPHHVDDAIVAGLVEGTLLRGYRFDRYKPAAPSDRERAEELILSAHHDISDAVQRAATIAAAQNRVRELGNRPANDLTPSALAEYAVSLSSDRPGLEVSVLDESEIREAGMGAFAAVAQGSAEPAKLIRLEYDGTAGEAPMTALIGKAVTFDSGGLWLKPQRDLPDMKFDMGGGAAVIEAIATLSDLGAPVHVIGVVGATENMISGRAVKPGDIVTALSGKTIEVNNTDAEGRLVLADCITYARREGAQRLIDIATLTGGIVVALGKVYAGLMSNDDELAAAVENAGARTGELVWRMPLHERYADLIKGRYAQIANLSERREGSAITAAEFLHHFAEEVPWAHLDIAGTADRVPGAYIADRGATGFGLRLLVELALSLPG